MQVIYLEIEPYLFGLQTAGIHLPALDHVDVAL